MSLLLNIIYLFLIIYFISGATLAYFVCKNEGADIISDLYIHYPETTKVPHTILYIAIYVVLTIASPTLMLQAFFEKDK